MIDESCLQGLNKACEFTFLKNTETAHHGTENLQQMEKYKIQRDLKTRCAPCNVQVKLRLTFLARVALLFYLRVSILLFVIYLNYNNNINCTHSLSLSIYIVSTVIRSSAILFVIINIFQTNDKTQNANRQKKKRRTQRK